MNETTERILAERLSAYVDGELPPEEEAALLAALEGDEAAQRELDDLSSLSVAIQGTLDFAAEEADLDGFADAVMERIEAAREAPAAAPAGGFWAAASAIFSRRRAPFAVGAAAFAAAALAISPMLLGGGEVGRLLLDGDPADAAILSMTTGDTSGATVFKTDAGTTIIYLTSRE